MAIITVEVPIPGGVWTKIAGPKIVQVKHSDELLVAISTAIGDVAAGAAINTVPAFRIGLEAGRSDSIEIRAGLFGAFRSPQDIDTVVITIDS
ncbi:MAG: hypothetical protein U5N55_11705 [Cypionkella sp.]|nr:hypothetical protein [Cypionkella sp.]